MSPAVKVLAFRKALEMSPLNFDHFFGDLKLETYVLWVVVSWRGSGCQKL